MNTEAVAVKDKESNELSNPTDMSVGALESALAMGDLSRLSPNDRLKMVAGSERRVGLAVGHVHTEAAVFGDDGLLGHRVGAELAQRLGRLAAAALSERGLCVQWVPTHAMPAPFFETLLRTFADSFEHSSAFWIRTCDSLRQPIRWACRRKRPVGIPACGSTS